MNKRQWNFRFESDAVTTKWPNCCRTIVIWLERNNKYNLLQSSPARDPFAAEVRVFVANVRVSSIVVQQGRQGRLNERGVVNCHLSYSQYEKCSCANGLRFLYHTRSPEPYIFFLILTLLYYRRTMQCRDTV